LENLLRLKEVAQSMGSQGTQADAGWECSCNQPFDHLREQDLGAVTRREQASQPIEWGRQIITVARDGLPRMQRHPCMKGSRRVGPLLRLQGPLGRDGGSNGTGSGGKGSLDRVTYGLEEDAAMSLDGRTEKGEVALNGGGHCLPVPLPQRGAALDVSEEKGDGAAGEIGHEPFPESHFRMNRVGLSHADASQKRLL
jgi:hypothetical protein